MPQRSSRGGPERVPCSFRVRKKIIERVRDIAFWTGRTIPDLADEAFLDFIQKLEREAKEPFEPRNGSIRGRPPKRKKEKK